MDGRLLRKNDLRTTRLLRKSRDSFGPMEAFDDSPKHARLISLFDVCSPRNFFAIETRFDVGDAADRAFARQRFVQPVLMGKLSGALIFAFANTTITDVEVIGEPVRLRELDIAVL